jgi:hypothetical protein
VNRKLKAMAVALTILASTSGSLAADPDHTGQWWRDQESPAKFHFVARLFDGQTIGSNLLEFGMSAKVLLKPEHLPTGESTTQKYVSFDGGQLVDGLDRFYSDPRNAVIPVSKASHVVLHSVAGTPRSAVQEMTEEYRKPGC